MVPLLLTLVWTIASVAHLSPCSAQSGFALGQIDLIRQVRQAAGVMRDYRKTHDHLPQLQPELDDLLLTLYKRINTGAADSTIVPQSRNTFRTYYQFAVGLGRWDK